MTDKELIELAAKAAGYKWHHIKERTVIDLWLVNKDGTIKNSSWNPLRDSGAALELAVKLNIDLRINNGVAESVWIDEAISETHSIEVPCDEAFEGMRAKYAATRRAIVRAAAEIGKAMQ